MRTPLHLLLFGLMLAACGPTSEAELAPASEGALGQVESALCAGSSVSSLTIDGISTYQGVMAGSGAWAVVYPANGVHLEYFIDNVLQNTDERTGSSGSWNFSKSAVACGSRTFLVKAVPMVIDSAGNRTVCTTSGPLSQSRVVSEPCPTYCGDGICNGTETSTSCAKDCCESSFCSDGTCCPSTGRCRDGRACML